MFRKVITEEKHHKLWPRLLDYKTGTKLTILSGALGFSLLAEWEWGTVHPSRKATVISTVHLFPPKKLL